MRRANSLTGAALALARVITGRLPGKATPPLKAPVRSSGGAAEESNRAQCDAQPADTGLRASEKQASVGDPRPPAGSPDLQQSRKRRRDQNVGHPLVQRRCVERAIGGFSTGTDSAARRNTAAPRRYERCTAQSVGPLAGFR